MFFPRLGENFFRDLLFPYKKIPVCTILIVFVSVFSSSFLERIGEKEVEKRVRIVHIGSGAQADGLR